MNDDWVILGGTMTPPWDEEPATKASANARRAAASNVGGRSPGSAQARRRVAERLLANPPRDLGSDEVQAHLAHMPARYWKRLNEEELTWHLLAINAFFRKLASPKAASAPVSVQWRHLADLNLTRVAFCSWNRHGLLRQIAASLDALRIGIQRAEIHTRADSLVLDVFDITEPDNGGVVDEGRMGQLSFLVEGAFSDPPRFASVWATQLPTLMPKPEKPAFDIRFDNQRFADQTLLRLETQDRFGLFYDLVVALTRQGLAVTQAHINTEAGVAKDQFGFTDQEGRKVTSPGVLRQIRKELVSLLTS